MPAPQYVIRSYGGGADVAQLVESVGPSDLSFTIAPTTGWVEDDGSPLGTAGPFTCVMDRFTASVEKVLCSSVNLTTGLVEVYIDQSDGWNGRGYDGTQPQAHVPGGSPSGVQTCWSSAEAQEANQAVFDVLGGGGTGLIGVPIGTTVDFEGTPLTLPSNFLVADGSAVSRTTYTACFDAITIQTTGTTTSGGATITAVPGGVTSHVTAGMKVTLINSGGAVYTVQSVTSTTIVLTSGTGVTAGTAGGVIVYPHGAGDGSTTFNLPDRRGRATMGQGAVGTSSQPTQYVGQSGGSNLITQSQLPTSIGTAAAQSVNDPTHFHTPPSPANTFIVGLGSSTQYISTTSSPQPASETLATQPASTGITLNSSAVTNSGGGAVHYGPYGITTKIVRVT